MTTGSRTRCFTWRLSPQPIQGDVVPLSTCETSPSVPSRATSGHEGQTYSSSAPRRTRERCAGGRGALGRPIAYGGNDLEAWDKQSPHAHWAVYDFKHMYAFFQAKGFKRRCPRRSSARRGSSAATRRGRVGAFVSETAAQWRSQAGPRRRTRRGRFRPHSMWPPRTSTKVLGEGAASNSRRPSLNGTDGAFRAVQEKQRRADAGHLLDGVDGLRMIDRTGTSGNAPPRCRRLMRRVSSTTPRASTVEASPKRRRWHRATSRRSRYGRPEHPRHSEDSSPTLPAYCRPRRQPPTAHPPEPSYSHDTPAPARSVQLVQPRIVLDVHPARHRRRVPVGDRAPNVPVRTGHLWLHVAPRRVVSARHPPVAGRPVRRNGGLWSAGAFAVRNNSVSASSGARRLRRKRRRRSRRASRRRLGAWRATFTVLRHRTVDLRQTRSGRLRRLDGCKGSRPLRPPQPGMAGLRRSRGPDPARLCHSIGPTQVGLVRKRFGAKLPGRQSAVGKRATRRSCSCQVSASSSASCSP